MANFAPIAIIGAACKFPGDANSPTQFWQNIVSGSDSVEAIPSDRWDPNYFNNIQSQSAVFAKTGGFIHDIFDFDPVFFGISPREAEDIDPQQRLLLQLAWRTSEDAATSTTDLSACSTGVFVGVINHDYARVLLSDADHIGPHTGLGRSGSIAANRISYAFDFCGPSVAIDTACSSSLVAVDKACRALHTGGCDVAFAGGANAILLPESYLEFGRAQMLSATGRCRAFDAKADGFVRAEGGGMILLKRLSDAVADGDRIRAVILATVVNQDGKTPGIMSPSETAQIEMMKLAINVADISPSILGYVEAHGTGTQSGDVIEARSIGTAYGQTGDHPISVGSVKTNIGHTESAAGIAGLIKAMLSIEHNCIAPNLHFSEPNSQINFEQLNLHVPCELEAWPTPKSQPRIAAINSFGFGGTNAHAIIRQSPLDFTQRNRSKYESNLIPLSTHSQEHLHPVEKFISKQVTEGVDPRTVSFAAQRTSNYPYRSAFIFTGASACSNQSKLDRVSLAKLVAKTSEKSPPKVAFVFSGIAGNWHNTGRQLYQSNQVFKSVIDNCDGIFRNRFENPIVREVLSKGKIPDSRIHHLHPLLFSFQVALFELWRSYGVEPDVIYGHSIGEAAAACASGAMSLDECARIISIRCDRFQHYENTSNMVAAAMSYANAVRVVEGFSRELFIAGISGPNSVTFSGTKSAAKKLIEHLDLNRVFYRVLDITVPFHSPLIDEARSDVLRAINLVSTRDKNSNWVPSFGDTKCQHDFGSCEFWWNNFHAPFDFAQTIETTYTEPTLFVEVSPHPNLLHGINEQIKFLKIDGVAVPSLMNSNQELTALHHTLGTLYVNGINPKWGKVIAKSGLFDLPKVEFNKQRYSKVTKSGRTNVAFYAATSTRTCHEGKGISQSYRFNLEHTDWLRSHTVHKKIVFPAAGIIAIANDFARKHFLKERIQIHNLQLKKLISVFNSDIEVHLELKNDERNFTITSNQDESIESACGEILQNYSKIESLDITAAAKRCNSQVQLKDYESRLRSAGFNTQDETCQVLEIRHHNNKECFAKVDLMATSECDHKLLIHPGLLDTCIRASSIQLMLNGNFLPVSIDRIAIFKSVSRHFRCHAHLVKRSIAESTVDVTIVDSSDGLVAHLQGLTIRYLSSTLTKEEPTSQPIRILEPTWNQLQLDVQFDLEDLNLRLNKKAHYLCHKYSRDTYYSTVEPLLDQLTLHHVVQALHSLDLKFASDDKFKIEEIAKQIKLPKEQVNLFQNLFYLLAKHGKVRIESELCHVLEDLGKTNSPFNYRKFLSNSDTSNYLAEFTLIERCGSHLPEVLNGSTTGLEVLFPDGSSELLENLYYSSPTCRIYNELLVDAVTQFVERSPQTHRCNILEIGGGTGSLLAALEPLLRLGKVRYTFTDISSQFVKRAKIRFSHLNRVEFSGLDIDADPSVQEFEAESFDLVIASDTLHATHSIQHALHNVKKLLRPDGYLFFIELTNPPDWTQISFAMLSSWWNNSASKNRSSSQFSTRDEWLELLNESGFHEVSSITDQDKHTGSLHTLFISRANSEDTFLQHTASGQEKKKWLIFGDCTSFTQSFTQHFGENQFHLIQAADNFSKSKSGYTINSKTLGDYALLFKALEKENYLIEGVIFLWTLPYNNGEFQFKNELNHLKSITLALSYLLQAAQSSSITLPRVVLVTQGVNNVDLDKTNPFNSLTSVCYAISKTINNEYPATSCELMEVNSSNSVSIERTAASIKSNEIDDESSRSFQLKLTPPNTKLQAVNDDYPVTLQSSDSRQLDELVFTRKELKDLGNREIRIKVHASSLNFRDVMIALGALPDSAISSGRAGRSLGIECSGIVVGIGKLVSRFTVGDRVVALSPGSLSSHVTADERLVCSIPSSLSFEQACGTPTVYVTALLCLQAISDLSANKSVLVHTASGGVGLALINLLKSYDAKIFCTAGSVKKRQFLKRLGVYAVFDSRSTHFANEVLKLTNSRGADIIINTLAGSAAYENIRALTMGGTFIELGKFSEREDVKNKLLVVNPTARYQLIDLDAQWKSDEKKISLQLFEVIQKVSNASIPALPYQTFPVHRITQAFKTLASAKHIGKVVIDFEDLTEIQAHSQPVIDFSNGPVLIVGGTRGFGLATALWLAKNGAKSIALMSRSNDNSKQLTKAVNEMEQLGVSVTVSLVNIADFDALQSWLHTYQVNNSPVKFVFNCAMVIDDRLLSNIDTENLDKVFEPKINGTWNLFNALKHNELEKFVMYSSVTSLIGPGGQVAYSTANAFQNSFAKFARNHEVPAVSIIWGAVSDHGYVADIPQAVHTIQQEGFQAVVADSYLNQLPAILGNPEVTEVVVAAGDSMETAWTTGSLSTRHNLMPTGNPKNKSESGNSKKFRNSSQRLISCIARVLDLSEETIDTRKPIVEYGLDSLLAVELAHLVKVECEVDVSVSQLLERVTIEDLSATQ